MGCDQVDPPTPAGGVGTRPEQAVCGAPPASVFEVQMLSLPVVVNVDVPAYRDGLVATFLDAGFTIETPEKLDAWAAQPGGRAIVMSVDGPDDCATLAHLRLQGSDLVILALLADPTTDAYRDALRSGASAAVAWDASIETILKAFRAACDGQCLIPLAVVQGLVGGRPGVGTTALEERWLHLISAGCSSDELAAYAGCPERDMLHILDHLYERLGLSTQAEAGVTAGRGPTGEGAEGGAPPPP